MKRFWLFAGDDAKPLGGMADFLGSFPTLEQAMAGIKNRDLQFDWAEIILVRNNCPGDKCGFWGGVGPKRWRLMEKQLRQEGLQPLP